MATFRKKNLYFFMIKDNIYVAYHIENPLNLFINERNY